MSDQKIPLEPPPAYEDRHSPDNVSASRHISEKTAAPASGAEPKRANPPRGPFPLDIPVLNQLRGKRVILASASPRRKQLLAQIGIHPEIIPSNFTENLDKSTHTPLEYVLSTATQKCLDVYRHLADNSLASVDDPALLISADTIIVTAAGRILEKPRSEQDHINMLKQLRDQKAHKVYTAVVCLAPRDDAKSPGYNMESTVEETKVVFDENLPDSFIEAYVRTREAVGMAGGYGIQGMGNLLVERIEGAYDNVVGLPVRATVALMERVLFQGEDEASDDEDGLLVDLTN